jgi:hypothetical protein
MHDAMGGVLAGRGYSGRAVICLFRFLNICLSASAIP